MGSAFVDLVVEVPQTAAGQGLTFIGYQVLRCHEERVSNNLCFETDSFVLLQDSSTIGNVHTGI